MIVGSTPDPGAIPSGATVIGETASGTAALVGGNAGPHTRNVGAAIPPPWPGLSPCSGGLRIAAPVTLTLGSGTAGCTVENAGIVAAWAAGGTLYAGVPPGYGCASDFSSNGSSGVAPRLPCVRRIATRREPPAHAPPARSLGPNGRPFTRMSHFPARLEPAGRRIPARAPARGRRGAPGRLPRADGSRGPGGPRPPRAAGFRGAAWHGSGSRAPAPGAAAQPGCCAWRDRSAMRYWWIVVPVALLGAGAAFWAHRRAVAAAAPAAAYQTAPVQRGDIVSTMTATGTVEAWNESVVRVGVGVSGTLEPFTWNVSDQVQQGQVLFTLTNPQLLQQTQSDEASQQEAESALQQMEAAAADAAPEQAALHNAQLQVQQAQYAYGQALSSLQAEQQLVAPVSGTVSAVDGVAGESVGAGAAVASIVQTTGLLAEVDVPQAQLAGIAPGEAALVLVDGAHYAGQVQSIGPAPGVTYQGVPSYPVTVALPNPGNLLPGMPVTVSIETATAPQAWSTGLGGTLAPTAAVNMIAQAAGTLSAVSARVGQDVQAGQVLAELQSASLQNAVTAALQNLRQAEGALAALEANQAAAARAVPYSLQQQEIKVQTLRGAVAQDQSLEAGLVVRSPVSGVISGIQAVAGEPVGPGTPLLTIGDYSRLLVTFPLDQRFVNQVKVGQAAMVTATAAPGTTFSGSLYLVSPEGTDVNGIATFQAEVEIPRPTPQLRPGMAVTVSIVLGQARGVLTVPLQALHAGTGGKDFVVVVTPRSGASPSTAEVPVRVGLQDQLDAQVAGALRAGDLVLTGSLGALPSAAGLNVRGRVLQHHAQVTHRAPVNTRK